MAVSTIKNNRGIETLTLSNVRTGTIFYGHRVGDIVSITISANPIPTAAWTKLGDVNAIPLEEVSVVSKNAQVNGFGTMRVTTSGAVEMYHNIGSNQGFFNITLTYIAQPN